MLPSANLLTLFGCTVPVAAVWSTGRGRVVQIAIRRMERGLSRGLKGEKTRKGGVDGVRVLDDAAGNRVVEQRLGSTGTPWP
ncbi:MAG: hypothetical protein HQL80_06205 [Magnetococcales bacterium]|nr:hypothetical protein [Magnetococcales bacterium]